MLQYDILDYLRLTFSWWQGGFLLDGLGYRLFLWSNIWFEHISRWYLVLLVWYDDGRNTLCLFERGCCLLCRGWCWRFSYASNSTSITGTHRHFKFLRLLSFIGIVVFFFLCWFGCRARSQNMKLTSDFPCSYCNWSRLYSSWRSCTVDSWERQGSIGDWSVSVYFHWPNAHLCCIIMDYQHLC